MNKETEAQSSQKHVIKLGSQNVQRALSQSQSQEVKSNFSHWNSETTNQIHFKVMCGIISMDKCHGNVIVKGKNIFLGIFEYQF